MNANASPPRALDLQVAKLIESLLAHKDPGLVEHSRRVADRAAGFCAAGRLLDEEGLHHLYLAGLLHDVGHFGAPPEEGPRAAEDHPAAGAGILAHYDGFAAVVPLVRHHHEAFDGSGTPDGKRGSEIPLGARVLCLFEYFEERVSGGPETAGPAAAEILKEIQAKAGQLFDPELVPGFIEFVAANPTLTGDLPPGQNTPSIRETFAVILKRFAAGKITPPAMPQVVQKVRALIERPETSVKELSEVLEKDPVIALRVVAMARSPLYKGYGDITSIASAIPRLGFKETLSIVVTVASKSLYEEKRPEFRALLDKMWMHSLACAYASKLLAQSLFLGDPETVFLMGLTHDVGKAVLLKAFADATHENAVDWDALAAAIQEAHQSLGQTLLTRWKFGAAFLKVVSDHEKTQFAPGTAQEVLVVHLANMLTRKMGFSQFEWDGQDLEQLASAALLGANSGVISRVEEKMREILTDVAHQF